MGSNKPSPSPTRDNKSTGPKLKESKSKTARVAKFLRARVDNETIEKICEVGTIEAQVYVHEALLRYELVELQPLALQTTVNKMETIYDVKLPEFEKTKKLDDATQPEFNEFLGNWTQEVVQTHIDNSWSEEHGQLMLMLDDKIVSAIVPQVEAWIDEF